MHDAIRVPAELVDRLFPFHLGVDPDGRIRRVGRALARIADEVTVGALLADVFILRRPAMPISYAALAPLQNTLVVLETLHGGLRLRGQTIVSAGDELIFLGTPWITEVQELTRHGITLDDLPPHSSHAEMLFLSRAKQVATDNARALSEQLDQRRADLNLTNARLRAVLDTAAEGILTIGGDGVIRSFNAAAERLFGYRADEVLGRPLGMLMPEGLDAIHADHVSRFLVDGGGTMVGGTREVAGRHKSGAAIPIEISVSDASIGAEHVFTGIMRDLSERKRHERLRAAEVAVAYSLLRSPSVEALARNATDTIATTLEFDAAVMWLCGDDETAVAPAHVWIRRRAAQGLADAALQTRLTRHDLRPATGVVIRPTAEAVGSAHHQAAAAGELCTVAVVPMFGESKVHGVLELFTGGADPTGDVVKALESVGRYLGLAFERADALKRAEVSGAAQEQFLARMSHEIRTPLSGVIGLAHLLSDSALNEAQRDTVGRIIFAGEMLLGLVNNVLDFAKIAAGQLELAESPFKLGALIRDAAASLEAEARSKHLDLRVEIASDLPSVVWADPVRVTQILINLIANAIKFTARGSVTIDARLERRVQGVAHVCLRVIDTGVGIAPEDQARIFDAFSQAHPPTGSSARGTGLGLAIVQQLAERQGGTVQLTSALGEGSTFSVYLPLREGASARAPVAPPAEERRLAGMRVLIVDDDELNRFVAAQLLERRGATVVSADGGETALAILREQQFDLVLMDLQMPGMDGYTTVQRIREMGLTASRLPIAALTASVTVEERTRASDAGMVSFIMKPFLPSALVDQVERLVRPAPGGGIPVGAPSGTSSAVAREGTGEPSAAAEVRKSAERKGSLVDRLEEVPPEFSQRFLDQRRADLTKLHALVGQREYRSIADVAHRIKGTGATFGFPRIGELGRALEAAARAERAEAVQGVLDELRVLVEAGGA